MRQLLFVLMMLPLFDFMMGQSAFIPLRDESYSLIDRLEIKSGKFMEEYHSSNKPLDRRGVSSFVNWVDSFSDASLSKTDLDIIDHLYEETWEWNDKGKVQSNKPLFKVFYKHPAHLFHVDVPKFKFMIDPVFHFRLGKELDDDGLKFVNARGATFRGQVDDFFGFYFYITENQARFPSWVNNYVDRTTAVPGAGYYKEFKSDGYDYFNTRGYITFSATEHVHFQFGYDKNFIGDGYRSMFLSDNSNDYLFMKVNTRVWKFNYQNIFAELIGEYRRKGNNLDRTLPKKYMTVHHLSFNITKNFNIGLFEAVVFSRDKFELQYLNPIIFYRAIEQALGSPDNAFLGFDFKANFLRRFSLYGQFILDDFNLGNEFRQGQEDKNVVQQLTNPNKWWGTKFAGQLGLKYIDVFGIKNMDLQVEANYSRPYTYSHNDDSGAWAHYDQPLAHPLGANFTELITILRYQPRQDMIFKFKYIHSKQGEDAGGTNYGSNIFLPNSTFEREFGNDVHQGFLSKINQMEFRFTYMPWHNVNFDFIYEYRSQKREATGTNTKSHYPSLALRVNIPHRSYDF